MDSDTRKKDKKLLQRNNELERQKSRSLLKKRLNTEGGWLLRIVERVDYVSFERLSLLNWLTRWNPRWYKNMSVVETYVVGWLLLELIIFSVLVVSPNLASQTYMVILALVFLVYRWYNIITY